MHRTARCHANRLPRLRENCDFLGSPGWRIHARSVNCFQRRNRSCGLLDGLDNGRASRVCNPGCAAAVRPDRSLDLGRVLVHVCGGTALTESS
jgi:hypothetical protein